MNKNNQHKDIDMLEIIINTNMFDASREHTEMIINIESSEDQSIAEKTAVGVDVILAAYIKLANTFVQMHPEEHHGVKCPHRALHKTLSRYIMAHTESKAKNIINNR